MIREIVKAKISDKVKSVLNNISKITLWDIFNFYFLSLSDKKKALWEVIFWWDLTKEEDFSWKDFMLTAEEVKKFKKIERTIQYTLDQWRAWRTRNACVVFSWYSSLCNSLWIVPNYEEVLEFLLYFEKTKDEEWKPLWNESTWASIPKIHKFWCARWNELHPTLKVTYYRVHYSSKELEQALSIWYQAAWWYNTFEMYSKDRSDWFINSSNYTWWKRAWWHAVCRINWNVLRDRKVIEVYKNWEQVKHNNTVHSEKTHIIDNYPTWRSATNIYEHSLISDHCANSIWYNWFYVIEANDPELVKETVKKAETFSVEKSSNLELAIKEWIITDINLDWQVTRREVWIIAWRLLNKIKK